ncbi:uncharacterized protein CLUP02_10708 [Colletotrichum lupini]|uniref:Uncharacterized protein n=1 Tax=Colletotrichum lupini TaxID=145971 RepID=A0A9Q8SYV2_9PEZI|nr:uncharacterized protein CLUP02_10708 [Colletotrichum lupini]UQC85211.1 hypothetical protein CLUP02_10708 [Colletotrichum lupini]
MPSRSWATSTNAEIAFVVPAPVTNTFCMPDGLANSDHEESSRPDEEARSGCGDAFVNLSSEFSTRQIKNLKTQSYPNWPTHDVVVEKAQHHATAAGPKLNGTASAYSTPHLRLCAPSPVLTRQPVQIWFRLAGTPCNIAARSKGVLGKCKKDSGGLHIHPCPHHHHPSTQFKLFDQAQNGGGGDSSFALGFSITLPRVPRQGPGTRRVREGLLCV